MKIFYKYGELEASPNGLVTFEIQLAESDDAIASLPVRIDPTSANLTLARTLDYETRRLWKVRRRLWRERSVFK